MLYTRSVGTVTSPLFCNGKVKCWFLFFEQLLKDLSWDKCHGLLFELILAVALPNNCLCGYHSYYSRALFEGVQIVDPAMVQQLLFHFVILLNMLHKCS